MSDISLPLISVVTVVLNSDTTLEKSIDSVISQKNEANIEYIIIDGGSKDRSVSIINSYSDSIDYWVSEPDTGIYNAWNKGLARAKGDYIAFLGADDFYYPGALKAYSEYIQANPNVEYVSSKVRYVGMSRRIIGKPYVWDEFRRRMTVAHVGSLHKRSLYHQFGIYDETLKIAGDYEFLLRAGMDLKVGYINFISAEMDGGGVSTRLAYNVLKETLGIKIRYKCCSKPVALLDWYIAVLKVFVKNSIGK